MVDVSEAEISIQAGRTMDFVKPVDECSSNLAGPGYNFLGKTGI